MSRFRRLVALFREDLHTHPIDRLAYANSIVSGLALYPQAAQTALDPATASALSPLTFGLMSVNGLVWAAYGIHRKSGPICASSALSVVAAGALFALSFSA